MKPASPYTLPAFRPREGGVLLKVRAAPGASRERVVGVHGDALKVAVAAPPERGKANEAIARVLARAFGVRPAAVTIHSGETSREKWFFIAGLSPEGLRRCLENPPGETPRRET